MKKIQLRILSVLLVMLPMLVEAQQKNEGIHFTDVRNWMEVLALAKKEHKPIFVDAYATWCAPCRKMDQEIYSAKEVAHFYNEHFISVKLQMDSTVKDDEHVKAFRYIAKRFASEYKVNVFPAFLFFNPDGNILHQDVGYKQTGEFIKLGRTALTPLNQYYTQVSAFRAGKYDMNTLFGLEKEVQKNRDYKLADSITKTIYNSYINKLNQKDLLSKRNLDFIQDHSRLPLFSSNDLIFKLALNQPETLAAVTKFDPKPLLDNVIIKEEVTNKIWKDRIIINSSPEWEQYRSVLLNKYHYERADSIIMAKKVNFFTDQHDTVSAAKARTTLVSKYPPAKVGLNVFYTLNSSAWDAFLQSSNPLVLTEALKWIELAMELESSDQYNDTRANLLYKLGRVDEAISMEITALEAVVKNARAKNRPFKKEITFGEYIENIDKMLKGQPTWPLKKP